MAYSTNKESPVFPAHAIGHTPYALLVPAYSQVWLVKTERRIRESRFRHFDHHLLY